MAFGRSKALRLVVGTGLLATVAGGLAVAGSLAVPGNLAGAATGSGVTMKVTGSVHGTLHAPQNDCSSTTAKGGTVYFTSKLGGSPATTWTLTFVDPHDGRWPGHTSGDKLGTSSFVLQNRKGQSWMATNCAPPPVTTSAGTSTSTSTTTT